MDAGTIIAVVGGLAAAIGGYITGKVGTLQGVAAVNQLLQSSIDVMKDELKEKDARIGRLEVELSALREMLTQRADVQAVRDLVDRIAAKVGA